jgi:hypothetical protein
MTGELVLKVAIDAAHGERIKGEAEVLRRLRWPTIVRHVDDFPIAGRYAILVEKAGEKSLARHLRSAEPPSLDLMRRFGEELLQTLDHLEQEGVARTGTSSRTTSVWPRPAKAAASASCCRLLARPHLARQYPGRHSSTPRPDPRAAQAAAMGPSWRALRGRGDPLRDADRYGADLGR